MKRGRFIKRVYFQRSYKRKPSLSFRETHQVLEKESLERFQEETVHSSLSLIYCLSYKTKQEDSVRNSWSTYHSLWSTVPTRQLSPSCLIHPQHVVLPFYYFVLLHQLNVLFPRGKNGRSKYCLFTSALEQLKVKSM